MKHSFHLQRVMAVYLGSDAEAARALYAELQQRGPAGALAVNLLCASKTSERAKVRRQFRSAAYDGKAWAMDQVCSILLEHQAIGLRWGWGLDEAQPVFSNVLYVDLPTGQVSYHSDRRGPGPEYPGKWDGVPDVTAQRVCAYAAQVLEKAPNAALARQAQTV